MMVCLPPEFRVPSSDWRSLKYHVVLTHRRSGVTVGNGDGVMRFTRRQWIAAASPARFATVPAWLPNTAGGGGVQSIQLPGSPARGHAGSVSQIGIGTIELWSGTWNRPINRPALRKWRLGATRPIPQDPRLFDRRRSA